MDMRELAVSLSKVHEHLGKGKIDWASDEMLSLDLGEGTHLARQLAIATMRILSEARAGKLDDNTLEAVKSMAATAAWLAEHPL